MTYTNPNTGIESEMEVPVGEVQEFIGFFEYTGVGDLHFHLPMGEVNGTLNVHDKDTHYRYKVTGDLDELLLNMGIFTNGLYKLKDTEITTKDNQRLVNRVS
jgi:hypothetical protein